MIEVTSAHEGTHVIITLSTYDKDDNLTDPDGVGDPTPSYPTIFIKKGETAHVTPVVASTEMTRTSLGTYVYYWDTDGLPTGVYNFEMDTTPIDGLNRHVEKAFTLTD